MSIINGVLKEELCGGGCSDKVRNFPSATVDDLNHHIILLLQKNLVISLFMLEQMTRTIQRLGKY